LHVAGAELVDVARTELVDGDVVGVSGSGDGVSTTALDVGS
jgi:hypothetical protein